ncbi:UDP-3-O-(3-hydroxymyristoyl) glucosamine N-acyltransferase, partial [Bacteroides ovatus]
MIQLSDIIEYIKEYVINVSHDVEDLVVKNISTLDSSLPECMGWIATYKKEKQKLAEQSNVKYLITDTEVLITPKLFNKVIIHVSNPRLVFILIAERFFHPNYYKPIDIQKSIGKNAQISPSATIMNASIGNNCIIHSNVVIY